MIARIRFVLILNICENMSTVINHRVSRGQTFVDDREAKGWISTRSIEMEK